MLKYVVVVVFLCVFFGGGGLNRKWRNIVHCKEINIKLRYAYYTIGISFLFSIRGSYHCGPCKKDIHSYTASNTKKNSLYLLCQKLLTFVG